MEAPTGADSTAGHIGTADNGTFLTYEVLPDGSVATMATEGAVATTGGRTVVGEQRINPEFEHFLEQFTHLLKQLHQVSNPKNILQTCTILQQLKVRIIHMS